MTDHQKWKPSALSQHHKSSVSIHTEPEAWLSTDWNYLPCTPAFIFCHHWAKVLLCIPGLVYVTWTCSGLSVISTHPVILASIWPRHELPELGSWDIVPSCAQHTNTRCCIYDIHRAPRSAAADAWEIYECPLILPRLMIYGLLESGLSSVS